MKTIVFYFLSINIFFPVGTSSLVKSYSGVWVRVSRSVLGATGPFEYEFVEVRVGLGTTSLDSVIVGSKVTSNS